MGLCASQDAVIPSSTEKKTGTGAAATPQPSLASKGSASSKGLTKKQSRGVLLARVPSKRLFTEESKTHPVAKNVNRHHKHGSASQSHGMSFTEIKLPADQVISLKVQQELEGVDATEVEAAGEDDEGAASVQKRVYKAVLEGMPAVLALMRAEPTNAEVQWWCCDGIASLCAGSPENRQACDAGGGPELIIATLKAFPSDTNVQLKGCWAVSNLSGDLSEKLGNLDGVEAVVAALRSSDLYELQSVAVRTLKNLCEASANARRARTHNAREAVQAVADAHPDDGELVYRCTTLIKMLKPKDDNASMYLERVPTKRVFDNKHSMRGDMAVSENIHPTQRRGSASRAHGMSFTEINLPADQVISVHTEALVKKQSTLKEVIEDEKQREKTVADRVYDAVPGGVPAVLDLMRSDPRHAELQWWCADAIASLTVGKADNQAKVIELGGAQLVLAAMERFPDNENVASKGMWAITNVAATQATALGELGAIHAVLVSVKLCPTFEVQSVFIRALGNLIHGNDANLHTALAEGAKKAVRSVAADNAGSGQLLYRAGMLMQALGGSLDDDDDDEEEEEEVVTVVSAAAAAGEGAGGSGAGTPKRTNALSRVESRRLFDSSAAPSPKSTSVGRRQRRGSVSKAHGMSFTEIKLPADQVVSLKHEAAIQEAKAAGATHDDVAGAADPHATPAADSPAQVIYRAALDGMDAVVRAMKADPSNRELQWHACDAVASLSAGKPDNRAAAAAAGGLEAVVACMAAFEDNVTVQLKGAWAVANLAADAAEQLGELGAVARIVHVLALEDYECRSVGVRALYNLCTTVPNTNRARRLGAADVVEEILESHAEDGQLVFRTNNLLAVLREEEEEVQEFNEETDAVTASA